MKQIKLNFEKCLSTKDQLYMFYLSIKGQSCILSMPLIRNKYQECERIISVKRMQKCWINVFLILNLN